MSVCKNIIQLKQQLCTDHCVSRGTNIFRPDAEINGNKRLQSIDTFTEACNTYGVCAKDAG